MKPKPTDHLHGAALTKAMDKIVRIQFEDVGELTNHLNEVELETRSTKSTYDNHEWDGLCQRHGIDGDSRGDWA